jgi:hypothetical protein
MRLRADREDVSFRDFFFINTSIGRSWLSVALATLYYLGYLFSSFRKENPNSRDIDRQDFKKSYSAV